MKTNLPTPMTARVELLIYQRVPFNSRGNHQPLEKWGDFHHCSVNPNFSSFFGLFNYECPWKKVVWLVQSSTSRRVKLRSITFYNYNHWCGSNWLPCLHMFAIVHCNFSWFSWGSNRFFLWSGWRMLEVHLPLWKIMDFVSWDDEIPNCFWKVIIHSMVPNHQPLYNVGDNKPSPGPHHIFLWDSFTIPSHRWLVVKMTLFYPHDARRIQHQLTISR